MNRKKRTKPAKTDLPALSKQQLDFLAKTLTRQIEKEIFEKKYAPVAEVLKLVATGAFLAASIAVPNLPKALKPFLNNPKEYEVWRRFNMPYLKRQLRRLERQKLVTIKEKDNQQVVEITNEGGRKILKYALSELKISKPRIWDGKWRLISYDLPEKLSTVRTIFREYLRAWGMYPLHESVLIHAYPCEKEVEFLREYLGIGEFVRIFEVKKIENDKLFRDFFGV